MGGNDVIRWAYTIAPYIAGRERERAGSNPTRSIVLKIETRQHCNIRRTVVWIMEYDRCKMFVCDSYPTRSIVLKIKTRQHCNIRRTVIWIMEYKCCKMSVCDISFTYGYLRSLAALETEELDRPCNFCFLTFFFFFLSSLSLVQMTLCTPRNTVNGLQILSPSPRPLVSHCKSTNIATRSSQEVKCHHRILGYLFRG